MGAQRALRVAAAAIVAVVAFPPYEHRFENGRTINAGFSPIWAPPDMSGRLAVVNTTLLTIELVALCLVVVALYASTFLRRNAP